MESNEENNENVCKIENNCIYDKTNDVLIAKIVFQCVNCLDIFNTIKEIHIHCKQSHQIVNQLNENQLIFNEIKVKNKKSMKRLRKTKPNRNQTKEKNSKQIDINVKNKRQKENYIKKPNHLSEEKNIYSTNESSVECEFCKKLCKSREHLENHLNLHINPQICDYPECGKRFTTKRELKAHYQRHTKSSFACDICHKTYTLSDSLNKHKKIHTNPKVCDYGDCGKQFPTNTQLKYHQMSHSKEKTIKCDYMGCVYATKNPICLINHKKTHNREKPVMCVWPECNKYYKTKVTLKKHISLVHKRIREYLCEWPGCSKLFAHNSLLIAHVRTHTGAKPYSCDWPNCGRFFGSTEVLKRHKYTHTGERPFHCDWPGCDSAFSASGTLNTHKKLIHKCEGIKRSRWDNKKNK